MKTSVTPLLSAFALACVALTACRGPAGDTTKATAAPSGGAERPARTLPLPSVTAGTAIPEAPDAALAARLEWDVPPDWIAVPPTMQMRFAQYRVPGDAGPAECVVFYFGPGQGGDAMSNIARWAGQFKQPDGTDSHDRLKTTRLQTAVPVMLAELTGTYDGGMSMTDAPAAPQPGAMLLGAIASGPDAPWFFKFTGPEATVRAQRVAFEKMLGSLRPAP